MERTGVYRKGRAGHVRNVGAYRMYQQHIKKWRIPLTAFLALFVVFATAPMVGDELQTSLLTSGQVEEMKGLNPVEGKKALLNEVHDFVNECEVFHLKSCVDEGRLLETNIASGTNDLSIMVGSVEEFASRFEKDVAKTACRYNLADVIGSSATQSGTLKKFVEEYGDVLDVASIQIQIDKLNEVNQALRTVVKYCAAQ